jgi:hypothetical protein
LLLPLWLHAAPPAQLVVLGLRQENHQLLLPARPWPQLPPLAPQWRAQHRVLTTALFQVKPV